MLCVLFVPPHWDVDVSKYPKFVSLMSFADAMVHGEINRNGLWSRMVLRAEADGKDGVVAPWIGDPDYAVEQFYTVFGEIPPGGPVIRGPDVDIAITETDFERVLANWNTVRSLLHAEGRMHQRYWSRKPINGLR